MFECLLNICTFFLKPQCFLIPLHLNIKILIIDSSIRFDFVFHSVTASLYKSIQDAGLTAHVSGIYLDAAFDNFFNAAYNFPIAKVNNLLSFRGVC